MFTLEKAANEASLMNISNVLFEDAEAMKWLAFYSNSSKWHKTHSSNIFTLILKEESNPPTAFHRSPARSQIRCHTTG